MPAPPQPPPQPPTLRSDALRNRERILAAARSLFAEKGIAVGFDEIARTAGVGAGTVYRRFPDRQTLLEALFDEKFDEVLSIAAEAVTEPDARTGVTRFCERMAAAIHRDQALPEVLGQSGALNERFAQFHTQMSGHIDALVAGAQRAGVMRVDATPIDLMVIVHLLGLLGSGDPTDTWRRYLTLLLESLWSRPDAEPLPGPAPTLDFFESLIRAPA